MAMITQCPQCHAAFKVVADQLRVRGGLVRCGQCGSVFDGKACLLDAPTPSAVASPHATPAVVAPSVGTPPPIASPVIAPSGAVTPAVAPAPGAPTTPIAPAPRPVSSPVPLTPPTPYGGAADPAAGVPWGMPPGLEASSRVVVPPRALIPSAPATPPWDASPEERRVRNRSAVEPPFRPIAPGTASAPGAAPTSAVPSRPHASGPAVLRTRGMPAWGADQRSLSPDSPSSDAMPGSRAFGTAPPVQPAPPPAPIMSDLVVPAVLRGRAARRDTPDTEAGRTEPTPASFPVASEADAFRDDLPATKATPGLPSYRIDDSIAASMLDDADFPAAPADDRQFSGFAPLRASRDETADPGFAEPALRRYSDIFVAQEHAPEPLDEPEFVVDDDASPAFAGERRFDDEAAPAFLGDARRRRRSFRLWSIACLLGLLVLGGQLLWIYRSALAEDVPVLRPLMQAVCGCTVGYVRHIDQIAIMSSSLHPQVGGKVSAAGQPYLLNVVLRNNYGQAQSWPALTLELTDISNTVIASRVLLPQSYLPADRQGGFFPGKSQISLAIPLSINIESGQVNGYQLEKFFP